MNKKRANFLWIENELPAYDYLSIATFVRCGFDVVVHSYNKKINLPNGATYSDASLVLNYEESKKYTQGGRSESAAAFSDVFRYRLQNLKLGWWFDTDIVCLRDVTEFEELTYKNEMVLGFESGKFVNGAVMYIGDNYFLCELQKRLKEIGYKFDWGTIGPRLITEVVGTTGNLSKIYSSELFYPIGYDKIELLFLPEYYEKCEILTDGSYCVHYWNDVRRNLGIPNNLLPPIGSYLYQHFIGGADLSYFNNLVVLDVDTCRKLISFRKYRYFEKIFRLIGNLSCR